MYYTYLLISPITNQPFYIGKGKGNRAYFHIKSAALNWQGSRTGNKLKSNTIKNILKKGMEVIIKLTYFSNEEDAFLEERKLIEAYGLKSEGGLLTNLTRGGEGYTRPGIKVDQYDMVGNLIDTFDSIQAASVAVAGNSNLKNAIKECCEGTRRSAKKFKWAYHGQELRKTHFNKIKCVGQFKNDTLIASFSSISDTAKLGFDRTCVSNCCRGIHKTHKGFTWKFIE